MTLSTDRYEIWLVPNPLMHHCCGHTLVESMGPGRKIATNLPDRLVVRLIKQVKCPTSCSVKVKFAGDAQ